jgi:glycosyltransferase involved in cell wall biosynthesis
MNVLFEGWFLIPHSYSIVLCFQLIGLYQQNKNNNKINIFIKESKYFFDKWNSLKFLFKDIYPNEYAEILEEILEKSKDISKIKFDLIYRITYPYNVSIDKTNIDVPKCIFYTSEFSKLDLTYFQFHGESKIHDEDSFKKYLGIFKNLYFTGPSKWSTNGLALMNVPENRNRTITHGVSTKIFYKDINERISLRKQFGFSDDDIVILNMGAFTPNKGVLSLFEAIYNLVIVLKQPQYKLVLKGLKDLYQFHEFLNMYVNSLSSAVTIEVVQNLFNEGYIKFIDSSCSFDTMRQLYNMCDVYISPYLAEGFNITPLEAIACGTHIMLPETGSTSDYIEDILKNCPDAPITKIKSNVVACDKGFQNNVDTRDMLNKILNISKKEYDYNRLVSFLEEKYSWEHVADLLIEYFEDIIQSK